MLLLYTQVEFHNIDLSVLNEKCINVDRDPVMIWTRRSDLGMMMVIITTRVEQMDRLHSNMRDYLKS